MNRSIPSPGPIVPVQAPDISAYAAGNTGVDYVHTFDSGRSGPHAMICALMHGNELCGAIALDYLLRKAVRPDTGRLSYAFFNVDAFETFDSENPAESRYVDEDMNRLWHRRFLECDRESNELRRARTLLPVIDSVDLLLDLHSMQHERTPLSLAGPTDKGRLLAMQLGRPGVVVADKGHAGGVRLRDYGAFADPASPRNAVLVECGQHMDGESVSVALEASLRFLLATGVASRATVEAHLVAPDKRLPPPRVVVVTHAVMAETESFEFEKDFSGLEEIRQAGTLIGWDGEREIRTPYDACVLVMPTRRTAPGHTAVRFGRYVD